MLALDYHSSANATSGCSRSWSPEEHTGISYAPAPPPSEPTTRGRTEPHIDTHLNHTGSDREPGPQRWTWLTFDCSASVAACERLTGFDGHVSPEEVLPVAPRKRHSDALGTRSRGEEAFESPKRWATKLEANGDIKRSATRCRAIRDCVVSFFFILHLNGVPLMSV